MTNLTLNCSKILGIHWKCMIWKSFFRRLTKCLWKCIEMLFLCTSEKHLLSEIYYKPLVLENRECKDRCGKKFNECEQNHQEWKNVTINLLVRETCIFFLYPRSCLHSFNILKSALTFLPYRLKERKSFNS